MTPEKPGRERFCYFEDLNGTEQLFELLPGILQAPIGFISDSMGREAVLSSHTSGKNLGFEHTLSGPV